MIDNIAKITGKKPAFEIVDCCDKNALKANKVLGWKTETPLKEKLLNAWKWQQTLNNRL